MAPTEMSIIDGLITEKKVDAFVKNGGKKVKTCRSFDQKSEKK